MGLWSRECRLTAVVMVGHVPQERVETEGAAGNRNAEAHLGWTGPTPITGVMHRTIAVARGRRSPWPQGYRRFVIVFPPIGPWH